MPSLKIGPVYWISTGLVALNFAFGGISSVIKVESSLEVFRRLGYPDYFSIMLGSAQLLGVAALLAPVPRTLREWAYAGLTFDVIAAAISLLAIGTSVSQLIFPVIALGLITVSYWTWPSRPDPGRNSIRC